MSAGQFKFVQENLINKFIKTESNQQREFFDTTDIILSTYINQCKAEAQESNLLNSPTTYKRPNH